MIDLAPLDAAGLAWAQAQVTAHHYLHAPVDARCSVEGYAIHLADPGHFGVGGRVGLLLVGRPEATRCYPWYGSVADVAAGRAACTRWEVLNLARVWIDPRYQRGGAYYYATPGFTDRTGVFRSTLASDALRLLVARVGADYLTRRPPCFLDEPYQLRWLLSYCQPAEGRRWGAYARPHRGTIYRAAGWECHRTNRAGLQTWRTAVPPLTPTEDAAIRRLATYCPRSVTYRARRAATLDTQPALL